MPSVAVAAIACPACIEALGSGVYEGFLWGMGLLMATPFLLLVLVGGGFAYSWRRHRREVVERLLEEDSAAAAGAGGANRPGGTS